MLSVAEDRRTLAAQLERHRYELLGRGLRDLAPDRGAPRVEEVIPANTGEGARKLQTTDDDVYPIVVERRVDHVAQELCAGGRVLRRLDHDTIAGGEHLDQRADREVEGKIPGNDVADDALGLRLDESSPGPVQLWIGWSGLGRHPA